MKMSDGLFLNAARKVAKEYPEIAYGEHIVDNNCMQLVMNPYQYDMLLLEIFTATSSPISAPALSAASAWCRARILATMRHL